MRSLLGLFALLFCFSSAFGADGELPLVRFEKAVATADGPPLTEGAPMALDFWREAPAPGERWLRGRVVLPPKADGTLRATVLGPDGRALGHAEAPVAGGARVAVNMRDAGAQSVLLRVEWMGAGRAPVADEVLLKQTVVEPLAPGTRIPVVLDVSSAYSPGAMPVTFGVPFPAGQLWSTEGLRVCDAAGRAVPAQFEVAAHWFEQGAIKWVRVDTFGGSAGPLFVELAKSAVANPPPAGAIRLEQRGADWVVHVGDTAYLISAELSPIREISRGGQRLASAEGTRGLYVITQEGEVASASARGATVTVESAGPVAACLRIEGPYRAGDREVARHVTRVEFAAGDPRARVAHSFIVSQSTRSIWFREIGWDFNVPAGAAPRALFATSPADWKAAHAVPLQPGESAWMAQDTHFQFLQGENHFGIGKGTATLHEGAECGDWAALQGSRGGLLVACRQAARRHPKEFVVTPGGVSLLLYSPRGGAELDFTLESRVRDLRLKNLLDIAGKLTKHLGSDRAIEEFLKSPNDALGWSKTHDLVIAPVAPVPAAVEQVAVPAAALSFPVYAMASPEWVCASGALGMIHPYDPERFPEVEKVAENYIATLDRFGEELGEFGFIDYQAGPRFVQSMNPPVPLLRRNLLAYAMSDDLWYAYARRGQRSVREFAQGVTRFQIDSHMYHASGPNRIAGAFIRAEGEDTMASPTSFPVPWGATSDMASAGSHSLERYLLDYYLTGNRRGRDVVLAYGTAARKFLTNKERMKSVWRGLRFINCMTQVYSVSWDPALRDLIDEAIDFMYRPDGELKLTLEKPYSTSYKTPSDLGGLIFMADVLRDPRITAIRDRVVQFVKDGFGHSPFGYMDSSPWAASLLLGEGEIYQGQLMAMKLRQMAAEAPSYSPPFGHFAMHGFAIAQKVALDSGAWEKPVVSFSAVETLTGGASWLFPHQQGEGEVFHYRSATSESAPKSGNSRPIAGQRVRVIPAEATPAYGTDTMSVSFTSQGTGEFRVPMDMVTATYQIAADEPGQHYLFANRRVPLVAYLPGTWKPLPLQKPAEPIFFKVPAAATGAELYLGGSAVLTDPTGQPLNGGNPVTGKVELAGADQGLWKLEMAEPGVITAKGFPPFFAFGDEAFFFVPSEAAAAWVEASASAPVVGSTPPARKLEFPGSVAIAPRVPLRIDFPSSGEVMPEGTVEFYYRFTQDVVELSGILQMLGITCEDNQLISLHYSAGAGKTPSYHLRFRFPAFDFKRDGTFGMFGERKFFPEKDRWYHIAISWGPSGHANLKRDAGEKAFAIRIFVDGEFGNQKAHAQVRRESRLVPLRLSFGPGIPAEVAALRISKSNRYQKDFQPPTPEEVLNKDEETLAVFDFREGKP